MRLQHLVSIAEAANARSGCSESFKGSRLSTRTESLSHLLTTCLPMRAATSPERRLGTIFLPEDCAPAAPFIFQLLREQQAKQKEAGNEAQPFLSPQEMKKHLNVLGPAAKTVLKHAVLQHLRPAKCRELYRWSNAAVVNKHWKEAELRIQNLKGQQMHKRTLQKKLQQLPAFIPKAKDGRKPWEESQPPLRLLVLKACSENGKVHPNFRDEKLFAEVTPKTLHAEMVKAHQEGLEVRPVSASAIRKALTNSRSTSHEVRNSLHVQLAKTLKVLQKPHPHLQAFKAYSRCQGETS
jgi:hypothetical protein